MRLITDSFYALRNYNPHSLKKPGHLNATSVAPYLQKVSVFKIKRLTTEVVQKLKVQQQNKFKTSNKLLMPVLNQQVQFLCRGSGALEAYGNCVCVCVCVLCVCVCVCVC